MDSWKNECYAVARALLGASNRSWASINGELATWHDGGLLEVGRRRCGEESAISASGGQASRQFETRHRFWAAQEPWRLRLERVRANLPDEQYAFSSMIMHGRIWWVEAMGATSARVVSNAGQENQAAAASQGMFNLDNLLRPAGLAGALVPTDAVVSEVDGRAAILVRGGLLERSADAFWMVGGLMSLGANEYIFAIDAAVGVLLRAEALIDGQVARREELRHVTVDTAMDASLFVPRWQAKL